MLNQRYTGLLGFLLCLSVYSHAQSPALSRSPISSATAHTTTFTGDEAFMANPAGLSEVESSAVQFAATTRFGESAFTTVDALAAFRLPLGTLEVSASHFGDEVFGIDRLSVATGHKLGIALLGVRIHTFTYRTESTGSRTMAVFESGGIATLSEKVAIGAYILNPGQAKVSEAEYFPTLMCLGISYRAGESLYLLAETEKDVSKPAVLKAGLKYHITENVSAMAGIRTAGYKMSAGLAFHQHRFTFQFASRWAGLPGFSHQLALNYKIIAR